MRWRLQLEEYNFYIVHISGKLHSNADALSRINYDILDKKKTQFSSPQRLSNHLYDNSHSPQQVSLNKNADQPCFGISLQANED